MMVSAAKVGTLSQVLTGEIILIIVGALLVVFAIIGTVLFPRIDREPLSIPRRIGVGGLGIFLIILGLLTGPIGREERPEAQPSIPPPATASNSPTTTETGPSSKEPEGKIVLPLSGTTVKEESSVAGTANNIPGGHQLWIITAYGQEYFPDGGPFQASTSGRWSGMVYIGGPEDGGQSFTVHLVAAGPAGSKQFAERLKEGEATGNYIDIPRDKLASDLIFLDSITITRE